VSELDVEAWVVASPFVVVNDTAFFSAAARCSSSLSAAVKSLSVITS